MAKPKSSLKKNTKTAAIDIDGNKERKRNFIILGIILAATYALFAQALNYRFVNYDDGYYIINNALIKDFSIKGLFKIFTTPVIGMYNPLTFVVYAVEHRLWGLEPKGYYCVNILIHLVAIVGAFQFIFKLTKRYETASIVALLFAIHPMHAVVVTWASETKTSLYSMFYFFALCNYISYVQNNYKLKYLFYTGILFILALLSKPSAVTLAPMLFLVDYYLNRRLNKKMILEKLPFFALSLFFGILTFLTHAKAEDAIFEKNNYTLINNLLISNYSLAFYLNKVLLPVNLCAIYTYPKDASLLPLKYYISILTIPFVLWLIYKSKNLKKEMIFGFLYFIISISVLLRIIPSGFFRASNVYTYMSYTGLFFIVAQVFTYALDRKIPYASKLKPYLILFLAGLTLFYAVGADARIKIWQSSLTFYNDIIQKNPSFAFAYNGRGQARMETGEREGAIADYTKCIELDSLNAEAFNNRGKLFLDMNKPEVALKDFNTAIHLDSTFVIPLVNRGTIMYGQHKYKEALTDYNLAIKYNPDMAEAYYNRAMLETDQMRNADALRDIETAIALNPDLKEAAMQRSFILNKMGKHDEAAMLSPEENGTINSKESYNRLGIIKKNMHEIPGAINYFTKAIDLDINYVAAYTNRGAAYFEAKNYEAAMADLNHSLQLDPENPEAYVNRGIVQFNLRKYDEAMLDYNQAIKYDPQQAVAYRKRAMIKVIRGDFKRATEDLDKAISLNPQLENAYIDKAQIMYLMGNFPEALNHLNKAIQINPYNKDAYNNRAAVKIALKDTTGANADGQIAAELAAQEMRR